MIQTTFPHPFYHLYIMINLQPTLIGKLTKIRPLYPSDFQALYKAASDRQIWIQHPQPRRWERDYFREHFFDTALACKGGLIFQNPEGEIIGSSRYYIYREQKRDITVGYTFFVRKCWGTGHNRETKHLMLSHIYQWVDTIYFTVGVNNVRSRIAMGRIGGILLTTQQQVEKDVVTPGSVLFQIKKRDFKGLL